MAYFERTVKCLREVLADDEIGIRPETSLAELDLDSLAQTELGFVLGAEFDVDAPELTDLEETATVGDLAHFMEERVNDEGDNDAQDWLRAV